jgi:(1->4)-alpha-D-glucan 1-alpha-D-glucosylmutase
MRRLDPELFLSGAYLPLDTDVTVPAGAIAFARVHGDTAALFIGPRLCAPLIDASRRVPLGDTWKTSRVVLPSALADRSLRHEITGAEIRPTAASGQAWIFLGEVFAHVPIGILKVVS